MADRKLKPDGDADKHKHPFGKFMKSNQTGKKAPAEPDAGSSDRKKGRRPNPEGTFRNPRKPNDPARRPGKPVSEFRRRPADDGAAPRDGQAGSRGFKRPTRDGERPPSASRRPGAGFKRSPSAGRPAPDAEKSRTNADSYARRSDRKDSPLPQDRAGSGEPRPKDEVTFSKTLEDKWATPPVSSRRPAAKHLQPQASSKRRIKGYFIKENAFEKAYDAEGRKKFTGGNAGQEAAASAAQAGEMPLNKYIAHCGVCSRRDAVSLIKDGKVTVNEAVVTEPGFKVQESDTVSLQGKVLHLQHNLVYLLLNKPKGYITTTDDPKGRRTVMDLISGTIDERVFPIGRLDRNTTGLLLLTNDGQLAQQLAHPKFEVRKVYMVTLDKNLSQAHFEAILAGLELEDGRAEVDELEYLESKNEIGIQIHSGKNRIVRRIFESLGYVVEKLDRVVYAGLTKKNLARGKWRFLSQQEIINLKHFSK